VTSAELMHPGSLYVNSMSPATFVFNKLYSFIYLFIIEFVHSGTHTQNKKMKHSITQAY